MCATGPNQQSLCAGAFTIQEPLRTVSIEAAPQMQQARSDDLERALSAVPLTQLEAIYDAGADALAALQRMADLGHTPVTAALEGVSCVEEWAHYPDGDARSAAGRYYYHAHPAEERGAEEHGHFHIFLEPPLAEPDAQPTHVVGIAMDAAGRLLRLFTTNGWVTGETWREAEWIITRLPDFHIASDPARRDLDEWISAIIRLFRPQIEALLSTRDAALASLRAENPEALEDRSVRILSETQVDLLSHLHAAERAMEEAERARAR